MTRFVNNLMLDGKKSIAYNIFYDAVEIVGEKMKDADKAPLDIWKKALENITPHKQYLLQCHTNTDNQTD